MEQGDKVKIYKALLELGVSARKAEHAVLSFALAMEEPKRILVVEDFSGLTTKVVAQLKEENERMKYGLDPVRHPDGWYRKFYKPHGKRNLGSR